MNQESNQDVNYDIYNLGDIEKIGGALEYMGFSLDDTRDPNRMNMLNDISTYLNALPDPDYFVQKAIKGKQVDRIQFMYEYIDLHKQLESAKSKVDGLTKEIELYEK